MKNIILNSLLVFFISYLFMSFLNLELNPSVWNRGDRGVLIFATGGFIAFVALYNLANRNN